jgi:VanZ family protein
VGAYAALAAALWVALRGTGRSGGPPRVVLWAAVTAWAGALEVAKVLVPGRAPNVDNALLGAAGAAAALLVAPWVAARASVRRQGRALLVVAALALVAYEELTPFDWAVDAASIRRKLDRLEWLPGASYYLAELRPALFDAGKKLVLGLGLGAALAAWRGRGTPSVSATAAIALSWGAAMEALQILQRSHVPALTDALLLAIGAVLGHLSWEQIGRGQIGRGQIGVSEARH